MPPPPVSSDSQPIAPPDSDPDSGTKSFPDLRVQGRRLSDYALKRLKASFPLQICMGSAFVCYGALVLLVVSGRISFPSAGVVVLLSLASWFFLFWWYPVLERTTKALAGNAAHQWIPRALELCAIVCVVVVHALMLVIVLAW